MAEMGEVLLGVDGTVHGPEVDVAPGPRQLVFSRIARRFIFEDGGGKAVEVFKYCVSYCGIWLIVCLRFLDLAKYIESITYVLFYGESSVCG